MRDQPAEPCSLRNSFFVGFEAQRYTIAAIAQPGRPGTVFKDVAVMTIAVCAVVLGALHKQFAVRVCVERVLDRAKETRPAGTAVEFHVRPEKRMPATGTNESAFAMFIVERTGETAFRAFISQHLMLLGCQRLAPFVVRFFWLASHTRYCIRVGASNRASWQDSGDSDHDSGNHIPP